MRSLRCHERLGFRREAARRDARFHDGKFHDAVQMAILESRWRDSLREKHREYLDSAWEGPPSPGDSSQREVGAWTVRRS